MTHPSMEYVLVGCAAATATFLVTPVARRVAIWWHAVALPRDRDVHAVATPRMGGAALFVGFAFALFLASRLPTLHRAFSNGPVLGWVVGSAAIICALGIVDDRWELDSITKLAGQVLATGLMVTLGGVQLETIYVPFGGLGTISIDQNLGLPLTVLFTVLTINAMNFIDGLDGLAAGVTVIAASAFFVFSYELTRHGYQTTAAVPSLLAAALAGACLGFLPHNFFPARIFMGDSGSMVVGMMLAAAATTATSSVDPQGFNSTPGALPLLIPIVLPLAILALPFIDLVLAVFRRVRRGRSPFAPDKQHLHHRLLELGHSHRRAVLLLYFWSALIASLGVGLSFEHATRVVLWTVAGAAVVGILVSVVPRRRSRPDAEAPTVAR